MEEETVLVMQERKSELNSNSLICKLNMQILIFILVYKVVPGSYESLETNLSHNLDQT